MQSTQDVKKGEVTVTIPSWMTFSPSLLYSTNNTRTSFFQTSFCDICGRPVDISNCIDNPNHTANNENPKRTRQDLPTFQTVLCASYIFNRCNLMQKNIIAHNNRNKLILQNGTTITL